MKNNNEQFENFIRDFDTIRMTATEKNEIQKNLELFAHNYTATPSPYYHHISFFKKSLALALIMILSFSASKPAAAKALPGEFLYNVKIIHEKIEAAAITEPKKKVDFEIKRTETRIREAVELAETKKLDTKKQEKIAQEIKKHVKKISQEIKEIKEKNPEQALALNSELKTTLKINSEALKEVTKKPTKIKKRSSKKVKKIIAEIKSDTPTPKNNDTTIVVHDSSQSNNELMNNDIREIPAEYTITPSNNELDVNLENSEIIIEESVEAKDMLINPEEKITINELEEKESSDQELTESFADIILDSIENDIEGTEIVDDIIKEEIIAEENSTRENIPVEINPITETEDSKIKELNDNEIITTSENTTKIEEENIDREKEINIEISKNESPVYQSDEAEFIPIKEAEGILISTEEKGIQTQGIEEASFEYTKNLKTEIASMEHILLAEENLTSLLTELQKIREPQNSEKIRKLIKNNQLGQAYITIQNEIESLSELKLEREIGDELGIAIETRESDESTTALETSD